MKELKYIKLFEAFASNKINKTLSFLNKDSKIHFLSRLKQICNVIDFPESQLSDDLFEYLPYTKAVKYNGISSQLVDCTAGCDNGKITRKWGKGTRVVDCPTCNGTGKVNLQNKNFLFKFWFDKDGKYITVTAVDGKYRPGNIAKDGKKEAFSTNLEDYNIGERIPKTRMFDSLSSGDIVKLTLVRQGYYGGPDIPDIVAFILKEKGRIWAIQNLYDYKHRYSYIDRDIYKSIGSKAWEMTNTSIRDIFKLNIKVSDKEVENPFGYNTDVDDELKIKPMGIENLIKNAHFAIVLDFGKLKGKEFIKKKDIIKSRVEMKSDALALMKDSDIKKINLKRYFAEIFNRTKLVGDMQDIINFRKIIIKLLGGKYSIYNLAYGSNEYLSRTIPSRIANSIFRIIKSISIHEKSNTLNEYLESSEFKSLVESANEHYSSGFSEMLHRDKKYSSYIEHIKNKIKSENYGNKEQMEILDLLESLSSIINKYLGTLPCECLEDVEIIVQEITSIREILNSDRSGISSLSGFFGSMNPSSWYNGGEHAYRNLSREYDNYHIIINGLKHLISVINRKREIYSK